MITPVEIAPFGLSFGSWSLSIVTPEQSWWDPAALDVSCSFNKLEVNAGWWTPGGLSSSFAIDFDVVEILFQLLALFHGPMSLLSSRGSFH